MTISADVWRAAKLLLDKYGLSAEERVGDRMLELLRRNDVEGHTVWSEILAAINEFRGTELRDGELVN